MSAPARPVVQVVIGSTRPGRIGPLVAEWVMEGLVSLSGQDAEIELVDLRDLDLPLYDEPNNPMSGDYVHDHTKAWSAVASRADGFVFVTPEYNHGPSAATKNAIDYLFNEWMGKPVGFAAYGGVSGGIRAVQQLKQIVLSVGMTPVFNGVVIHDIRAKLQDGLLVPTERDAKAREVLAREIVERAGEFAARRRPRPVDSRRRAG